MYLSTVIMDLLKDKQVFIILILFIFIILAFALQDIAVDGWAVEMLHPSNTEQASPC